MSSCIRAGTYKAVDLVHRGKLYQLGYDMSTQGASNAGDSL